jgi:sialate O-acetylesterase
LSNHRPRNVFGILAAALLGLVTACVAPTSPPAPKTNVTVAPIFGDHAVLQAGMPVPVWGTAAAGDSISVAFGGRTVRTVASGDGKWSVSLDALAATSVPGDLVVTGQTAVTLHDVVVGEVWLCSGQSNMEFTVDDGGPVYRVENAAAELATAHYPLIRQFKVERAVAMAPIAQVTTEGWKLATPETVAHFTAVGYFFARDIHRAVGVPVGIILTSWGGTPIESWMSDAARNSTSLAATLDVRWKKAMSEWPPDRVARYPGDMKAWQKAEADAHTAHTKNLLPWPQPPATNDSPALPGGLFNAMIAPLQPYAIRGVLWYQGEANVGRASEYAELLMTMIRSWRAGWAEGDFPFDIVQLANFSSEGQEQNRDWAMLREAQSKALALPETGMAVTIDIGSAHNIHPPNKQEVGRRLALIANSQVYHVAPDPSGPVFENATREGSAMRVRFLHTDGELVEREGPIKAMEIAGADQVFHPAGVDIDTDTLLVSSPEVSDPVAVRYAWTNAPVANLYNEMGLPAAPFRSDAW